MRFKFKVNLFNEEKPKHTESGKKQHSGKRGDRKRFPKPINSFKKSTTNLAPQQRRETKSQRGHYEERDTMEYTRRDVIPQRRTSVAIKPPRVGARRDFPVIGKNPKLETQNKLSKKADARLDALRAQLGFEFDQEYGAQMKRVSSIQTRPSTATFERTRSVPTQRSHQTATTQPVRQMPFARNPASSSMYPKNGPSVFNNDRQPPFVSNQASSFTPYSRPPSRVPVRAQQPPKVKPQQSEKAKSQKRVRGEAKSDGGDVSVLGCLFSRLCQAGSECNKVQSGCTNIEAGCTSATKCADGSYFDEGTLWTQSETLSDTEYDNETRYDGETIYTRSYIKELESEGSDSDFEDDSSWGDATSYQSEDDTHHHDCQKHKASRKKDERKQDDRPSSRSTRSEKHANKSFRVDDDETRGDSDGKLDKRKPGDRPFEYEKSKYSAGDSGKRKEGTRPSSRSTRSEKRGSKSHRAYDDETNAYSDGDSSYTDNYSEEDTYYHTVYGGESQWTDDGETYLTRETRRHSKRRRYSESSDCYSDSESDSRSYTCYSSEDSYDTKTYGDSTWRTNGIDDETYYDDETIYSRELK